jgi:hypothetical protein
LGWVHCPEFFSVAPVDEVPISIDKLYSFGLIVNDYEVSVVFDKEGRCSFDVFW